MSPAEGERRLNSAMMAVGRDSNHGGSAGCKPVARRKRGFAHGFALAREQAHLGGVCRP